MDNFIDIMMHCPYSLYIQTQNDMKIRISPAIVEKLESRNISEKDLCQCFENIEGGYLEDIREEHKTDPATQWFVAPTNRQRKLKVMFILRDGHFDIKSAYDATDQICEIYKKYGF